MPGPRLAARRSGRLADDETRAEVDAHGVERPLGDLALEQADRGASDLGERLADGRERRDGDARSGEIESNNSVGPATGATADPGPSLRHAKISARNLLAITV